MCKFFAKIFGFMYIPIRTQQKREVVDLSLVGVYGFEPQTLCL